MPALPERGVADGPHGRGWIASCANDCRLRVIRGEVSRNEWSPGGNDAKILLIKIRHQGVQLRRALGYMLRIPTRIRTLMGCRPDALPLARLRAPLEFCANPAKTSSGAARLLSVRS